MNRYKRISKAVFLTLLIGCAYIVIASQRQNSKEIKGKFITGIFMNNKLSLEMPQISFYLYKNYCLEERKMILDSSVQTLNLNGKAVTKKIASRDSLVDYIFTDLKTGMCYQFDTNKTKPKLLSSFSVSNKPLNNLGHNFKDNNLDKNELPKYVYVKDTTINGRNFKQLICFTDVMNDSESSIKISKVYLDKDLRNVMFHPLSKYLDDKFGGLSTIVEITFDNQMLKMEYAYTDGLNRYETDQIEKYIRLISSL